MGIQSSVWKDLEKFVKIQRNGLKFSKYMPITFLTEIHHLEKSIL